MRCSLGLRRWQAAIGTLPEGEGAVQIPADLGPAVRNAGMTPPAIDLSPLRKALAMLNEALVFWNAQPEGAPLKPHLQSAVIQSFEFT